MFGANKERKHSKVRKGKVNDMKKKEFLIKVTGIDLFIVCMLLIALLIIPAFQNLIAYYSILVYGVLCINMVVDLSVLILNKLKKDGTILKNMVIGLLITKLLVLFMASLYCIIIILAK